MLRGRRCQVSQSTERCATCGRALTWLEIAFGRFNDPVCGKCLGERPTVRALKRSDKDRELTAALDTEAVQTWKEREA